MHWETWVARTIEAAVRRSCGDDGENVEQDQVTVSWPLPFEHLAQRYTLTRSERLVLGCLVASQTNQAIASQLEGLSGANGVTRGGLLAVAYHNSTRDGLRELGSGSLVALGLMEVKVSEQDGFGGWSRHPVRVTEQVMELFFGASDQCARLRSLAPPYPRASPTAPVVFDSHVLEATRQAASGDDPVVVAVGLRGTGRRTLLGRVAEANGTPLLEVDASRLSKDPERFTAELRTLAIHCTTTKQAPLICNVDALIEESSVRRLELVGEIVAANVRGPIFATTSERRTALRWGRPVFVAEVGRLSTKQRSELWHVELNHGTREDAEFLATQYPLAPSLIHHAAKSARSRAQGRAMQPDDIFASIRAVLDDKLGDYAKRVEVTQTWDDLVLPADQMEAVQYLIARIRQRRTVYEQWGFAAKVGKGLGTSALFSGPPGTGKTMVAALVAKELGLELYQVDMAKITSKYIGETERNLAGLFDAAEAGHAILLFDEADSLFGKRTEVKSSNDRYANLETNYLLQRLESFTGICLLTSNHESNIDPAFQRRLSLRVRFEVPDVDERVSLWRAMLPAAAPVAGDVDFMKLARKFAMTGGYIRNAAMRAAFLAADEGSDITGAHLERAARLEYEGMGKIAAF